MMRYLSYLTLVIAFFTSPTALRAQTGRILHTTADPLDHTSHDFTVTVRDDIHIWESLWNDIQTYRNTINELYRKHILQQTEPTGDDVQLYLGLLEDVYLYTDAHPIAETDREARNRAEEDYKTSIEQIKSATTFDELYDNFATPELRKQYRDIILWQINAAAKRLRNYADLEGETQDNAHEQVKADFWNESAAEKPKRKTLEELRTAILANFAERHDAIIQEKYDEYYQQLRHSPMVYSSFNPVIEQLNQRTNTLLNSETGKTCATLEAAFHNDWYPWVKQNFPNFDDIIGRIRIEELTTTYKEPNPYYDPDYEEKVAVWNWVDNLGSNSYSMQGDYRVYDGHLQYHVVQIDDDAMAVYDAGRLVAVTKGFEPKPVWAIKHLLYYADYEKGRINMQGMDFNEQEDFVFRLKNRLPITPYNKYATSLDALHQDDDEGYALERYGGLTFRHHLRNFSCMIEETYYQGHDGNIYRSYQVLKYDE